MSDIKVVDATTMAVGAAAWAMFIPAVKLAGHSVATESAGENVVKGLAVVLGVGIAYSTTPLLSWLLGWKTPTEKVRGVALALGTAQTLDGLFHLFYPSFYHQDPKVGLACAGNIFFGAGLLGIFSSFQ